MINITQALSTIDWNTEELVYGLGTDEEFVIKTKLDYETKNMENYFISSQYSRSILTVLVDAKWTVRTRT